MNAPARFAFSTLAFPGTTLATAASLGRGWGYAGIELRLVDGELIDPGALPASARARIKRDLGGLPVVAVDSSIRLTDDDPGPALRRFLELASDWEAPLVRVFGGTLSSKAGSCDAEPRHAGPPDAAARTARLAAAARVLDAALPRAQRLGVAIGVETHDDFSSSAAVAELLALADPAALASGSLGAVWDSHHPHRMGETPGQVYANIGRHTLLAQVKDARPRDGGWQLVLLGHGEVPVRPMLGLLAAGGYPGWISVEWEKRWHPEIAEPEIALPQHLEVLTQWLSQ
ncbi:MAG: TIM barrel protein [Streptosporangiaceae bacterium]